MKIIPAILAKNSEEFQNKLSILDDHAEEVQIDIMDGQFVPEKTSQNPVEAAKHNLKYELHLMVEDPEAEIERWAPLPPAPSHLPRVKSRGQGMGLVTRAIIHAEIKKPLKPIIEKIKSLGWAVGLALNPETSHESIDEFIHLLDTVLVMTVHPGASGQDFAEAVVPNHLLAKITELHRAHPGLEISVDGGADEKTIPSLLQAGATRLIVNSAIFKKSEPISALKKLKHLTRNF